MAQSDLIQDSLSINTPVSEYIIPDGISGLTISTRGGDGGDARRDGNCDKRAKGGAGASVGATFEVGTANNQLQPGGSIKVYVGRPGGEAARLCAAAKSFPGAGGGGSTAVLYLPPNQDPVNGRWYILTVAGGGGGGAISKLFTKWSTHSGQGGQSNAPTGECGEEWGGYPGAGVNCDNTGFGGKRISKTVPDADFRVQLKPDYDIKSTGGADPDANDNGVQAGGDGFTGGGASSKDGAGGGGGYYGGYAGYTSGGGGGSFLTSVFIRTNTYKLPGADGGASKRTGIATFYLIPNAQ